MIGTEKCQATLGGRQGSEKRGVGVEHPEIFVGSFLETREGATVMRIIRAPAELIQSATNAALKIRNHGAHVVGNDLQFRILIKNSRQRKSHHGHTGLIRPAKSPPQIIV